MDEIDRAILRELQDDAKKSLNEISRSVNLSLPSVSERLRKMEKSGVIKKYTAILNPETFNKNLSCYCFLSLQGKTVASDAKFYEFVRNEPDIISCHCLTGQYEYLLKIVTESTTSLEKLLAKLRYGTAVKMTNTFVILSTVKDLPGIPVPPDDGSGEKEAERKKRAKRV